MHFSLAMFWINKTPRPSGNKPPNLCKSRTNQWKLWIPKRLKRSLSKTRKLLLLSYRLQHQGLENPSAGMQSRIFYQRRMTGHSNLCHLMVLEASWWLRLWRPINVTRKKPMLRPWSLGHKSLPENWKILQGAAAIKVLRKTMWFSWTKITQKIKFWKL